MTQENKNQTRFMGTPPSGVSAADATTDESVSDAATRTIQHLKAIAADVDRGLDATLDLGRAELALFRMGAVRIVILSISICGLLLSLWLVSLAGATAALIAFTGSATQAFALMISGIALSVVAVRLAIRRWLKRMSFPGVRRQVNALVDQWQAAS